MVPGLVEVVEFGEPPSDGHIVRVPVSGPEGWYLDVDIEGGGVRDWHQ